jgi:hypothetical protein
MDDVQGNQPIDRVVIELGRAGVVDNRSRVEPAARDFLFGECTPRCLDFDRAFSIVTGDIVIAARQRDDGRVGATYSAVLGKSPPCRA